MAVAVLPEGPLNNENTKFENSDFDAKSGVSAPSLSVGAEQTSDTPRLGREEGGGFQTQILLAGWR